MKKNKDETYNLRQIYEQMELELIASMKRNLKRHQAEEEKIGFKFEQWQSAKLRDLKRFQIENKKILDQYDPIIRKTVKTVLKDTYLKAQRKVLGFIKKLINNILYNNESSISFPSDIEPIAKELWRDAERPIEEIFFKSNDDKFKALMESVDGDFKKANATVLRRMDDIYRQTIFRTQVHLGQGAITLDKAIDMATKDFLEKGIDSIVYKDGKKVNIASYAEMALRTANHRSYLMGEGKKRQELGIPFVVVSAHATSCKLCLPWQGKVLIDDVYSGGKKENGNYPLLSQAMKEGFLHPNCRHNLNTYMGGSLPKVPDEKEIKRNYQAEQKQREFERKIRQQKRKIAGTIDKDNLKEEKKKLKELQLRMRNHLAENPELRRAYRREKILDTELNKGKIELSDNETLALNKYIGKDSYILNEKLRDGNALTDNDKLFIKDLDNALDKMPIYQGNVTRSVYFYNKENLDTFLYEHRTGNIVNYKAYTSTTIGDTYNSVAQIEAYIKSKNGKDICKYNGDEQEVLFKRDTKFIVKDVEIINEKYYLLMEEYDEQEG